MIPVIVKLCESPSKAGGLLMINYQLDAVRTAYPYRRKKMAVQDTDCLSGVALKT